MRTHRGFPIELLRPAIVVISVIFAAYVTYTTAITTKSAERITELKREVAARREENAALRAEVDDLRRKLQALQRRPEVFEQQIRSDLGLVRGDEIIVAFPEASP